MLKEIRGWSKEKKFCSRVQRAIIGNNEDRGMPMAVGESQKAEHI